MDAYAYARQLKQLLPQGAVWSLQQATWMSKLLLGIADELVRIDDRAANLVDEWDPRTADETLPDWEEVLEVVPADGATDAARRVVITARFIAQGGSTLVYFALLATTLGFVVTVANTTQSVWTMTVDLAAAEPFPLQTYIFRAGAARSGDRLRSWTIPELEDVINAAKQAHTRALFVYLS